MPTASSCTFASRRSTGAKCAMALLCSSSRCLPITCTTLLFDHGHRNSSGESHISMVFKPFPGALAVQMQKTSACDPVPVDAGGHPEAPLPEVAPGLARDGCLDRSSPQDGDTTDPSSGSSEQLSITDAIQLLADAHCENISGNLFSKIPPAVLASIGTSSEVRDAIIETVESAIDSAFEAIAVGAADMLQCGEDVVRDIFRKSAPVQARAIVSNWLSSLSSSASATIDEPPLKRQVTFKGVT